MATAPLHISFHLYTKMGEVCLQTQKRLTFTEVCSAYPLLSTYLLTQPRGVCLSSQPWVTYYIKVYTSHLLLTQLPTLGSVTNTFNGSICVPPAFVNTASPTDPPSDASSPTSKCYLNTPLSTTLNRHAAAVSPPFFKHNSTASATLSPP